MVPASQGRTIKAAIENFCSSIGDDSLAALVRVAHDEIDAEIDTVLDPLVDYELSNDVVSQFRDTTVAYGRPFETDYGTDYDAVANISAILEKRLEIH